jgi:hypothetical protein
MLDVGNDILWEDGDIRGRNDRNQHELYGYLVHCLDMMRGRGGRLQLEATFASLPSALKQSRRVGALRCKAPYGPVLPRPSSGMIGLGTRPGSVLWSWEVCNCECSQSGGRV